MHFLLQLGFEYSKYLKKIDIWNVLVKLELVQRSQHSQILDNLSTWILPFNISFVVFLVENFVNRFPRSIMTPGTFSLKENLLPHYFPPFFLCRKLMKVWHLYMLVTIYTWKTHFEWIIGDIITASWYFIGVMESECSISKQLLDRNLLYFPGGFTHLWNSAASGFLP